MKTLIQILLISMTFFGVYGQAQEVKISGNVTDVNKKILSDVPVVLMENNDTIAIKKPVE